MAKATFTFNSVQLQMAVRRRLLEMPHLARAAMNDVGMMIEREAKLRVPVDTGMLTACIRREIVSHAHGVAAVIYVPENSPGAQYAIAMHENQYRLGRNSQEKQRKVGVPVGRKYITRAMYDNPKKVAAIITRKFSPSLYATVWTARRRDVGCTMRMQRQRSSSRFRHLSRRAVRR